MANINEQRIALKKLYGKDWSEKVDKMKDDQVVAIYLRLKKQNKI